jgi:hypothetical protein
VRLRIGVSATLDEAAELVVRNAAPWLGLLWLTSVPVRLGQAAFAARIVELGATAPEYGDALRLHASQVAAALLACLWGRAVFVRACWLALRSETAAAASALRVPWGALLAYAYLALLFEALFYASALTLLAPPLCILAAGLAAAQLPVVERPGLLAPLRTLARSFAQLHVLLALEAVLAVALVVAAVNLFVVFQLGLWLAGGVPGLELSAWAHLLSFGNSRFVLALLAGASLAVEPFWLAALTVFVHRMRSRESGEDLRLWFLRLRREEAA